MNFSELLIDSDSFDQFFDMKRDCDSNNASPKFRKEELFVHHPEFDWQQSQKLTTIQRIYAEEDIFIREDNTTYIPLQRQKVKTPKNLTKFLTSNKRFKEELKAPKIKDEQKAQKNE